MDQNCVDKNSGILDLCPIDVTIPGTCGKKSLSPSVELRNLLRVTWQILSAHTAILTIEMHSCLVAKKILPFSGWLRSLSVIVSSEFLAGPQNGF